MSDRLAGWVYDHPDVWASPHRLGGTPCVRGTRVPVENIFHLFTSEDDPFTPLSDDEITGEYYPPVTTEQCARLRGAYENHGGIYQ